MGKLRWKGPNMSHCWITDTFPI